MSSLSRSPRILWREREIEIIGEGKSQLTDHDGRPAKNSVYVLKAKGEAEAKELQAQGLKRGEDFFDCE